MAQNVIPDWVEEWMGFRLIDWFHTRPIPDPAGVEGGSDANSHEKTSGINELESGNESLKI